MIQLFRLLVVPVFFLSLGACENEILEPANCLHVDEGWVPQDPVYIFRFREGVPVDSATSELVSKYNLTLRRTWYFGFSAAVPTFAAYEGLRCEPSLEMISWNYYAILHGP